MDNPLESVTKAVRMKEKVYKKLIITSRKVEMIITKHAYLNILYLF
jgi:hypothetical protein